MANVLGMSNPTELYASAMNAALERRRQDRMIQAQAGGEAAKAEAMRQVGLAQAQSGVQQAQIAGQAGIRQAEIQTNPEYGRIGLGREELKARTGLRREEMGMTERLATMEAGERRWAIDKMGAHELIKLDRQLKSQERMHAGDMKFAELRLSVLQKMQELGYKTQGEIARIEQEPGLIAARTAEKESGARIGMASEAQTFEQFQKMLATKGITGLSLATQQRMYQDMKAGRPITEPVDPNAPPAYPKDLPEQLPSEALAAANKETDTWITNMKDALAEEDYDAAETILADYQAKYGKYPNMMAKLRTGLAGAVPKYNIGWDNPLGMLPGMGYFERRRRGKAWGQGVKNIGR